MSQAAPAAALRLGLVGASGHMGRRVRALLAAGAAVAGPRQLRLSATLQRTPSADVPDAAGVVATCDPEAFAAVVDVVVDFSAPAAATNLAPALAARGVAYVVASTGLDDAARAALERAGAQAPVLLAANTSLGVWVLAELVQRAACLWPTADVEVVEVHHRRKRDAPSGTALALGQAVAEGWKQAHAASGAEAAHGGGPVTQGRGPGHPARQPGELGYAAVRGGDVVGEHTVLLLADGERLELTHRCTNADTFARGALAAASWLFGRAPGRYVFADVLGGRGG